MKTNLIFFNSAAYAAASRSDIRPLLASYKNSKNASPWECPVCQGTNPNCSYCKDM